PNPGTGGPRRHRAAERLWRESAKVDRAICSAAGSDSPPRGFPGTLRLFQELSLRSGQLAQEIVMSEYRDPRNPLDPPAGPDMQGDMRRSNSGLGWIAGAVFLIVVIALIYGLGHSDRTASTGGSPPPAPPRTATPPGPAAPPPTTPRPGPQHGH